MQHSLSRPNWSFLGWPECPGFAQNAGKIVRLSGSARTCAGELTAFSETPSLELREGKWQGKEQGGEGEEEMDGVEGERRKGRWRMGRQGEEGKRNGIEGMTVRTPKISKRVYAYASRSHYLTDKP